MQVLREFPFHFADNKHPSYIKFAKSIVARAWRKSALTRRQSHDAVIAAAAGGSDEALAQAMSAASAGGNGGGEAGTTSAPFTARDRGVHKKRKGGGLSIKERLQKKLLSGRAVGAALADSAVAEGERARERFGANRWENK